MPTSSKNNRWVFINIPFDQSYEKCYTSLIISLVSVGLIPRSVLHIPEHGEGRLDRLIGLIQQCKFSVHDLSRTGTPVRFNMPFELGLAYSIKELKGNHEIIMLDKKAYRLQKNLSDVNGRDPLIHNDSARRMIECILGVFYSRSVYPEPAFVYYLWKKLWEYAKELKNERANRSLYDRLSFEKIVSAANILIQLEKN